MSEMPTYHIMLLPSQNYWEWVQAVRDYAVHFHVSVTPRPWNAVNFHRARQVVTVVDVAGAYSQFGNIVDWFEHTAPDVATDVIPARTPSELRQVLARRMEQQARLGEPVSAGREGREGFRLVWPTDYSTVTQPFGANPDVYRRWGLPGHDGIDVLAPTNSNVYACADGIVYRVHDGRGGHPYGIHVRIRHADGYKTIYGHLNQALVTTQQLVRAGEVIGLADSTGNTLGSHLHLTLKKDGATSAGQTAYPHDIIDPTPYLVPRRVEMGDWAARLGWAYGRSLVGVCARHNEPMQPADWDVVRTARIEALKLTLAHTADDVRQALDANPHMLLVAHLTTDLSRRPVTAAEFAQQVLPGVKRFYDAGVRYFEVHNEPNLASEGYGSSWQDGDGFGRWFLEIVGLLRPQFPEARFGWPGLSPGATTSGVRFDYRAFLESAQGTIAHADWIGCHCYWKDEAGMFAPEGGLAYRHYLSRWPDRLVMITEFSNPTPDIPAHIKGSQYLQYYQQVKQEEGIGAAFAYVISSAVDRGAEAWRTEQGGPTPIVAAVATRRP